MRGRRTARGKAAGNQLWNRLRRRDNAWAVEVQPFDDQQIGIYLSLRFGGDRVAPILEQLRDLHPVDDLLRRPYLLTLVATSIDQWEQRGWPDRLTLTSVYESYVTDWLARDERKHRGLPVEASKLAQHLARVLWNRTEGQIGSRELRREASSWGSAVTGRNISPDEEDSIEAKVRTALFLVRDERGDYRFAHRSFHEFFLAKGLAEMMASDDGDLEAARRALDLVRLTPEVAAFLHGWSNAWDALPAFCLAVITADAEKPRASANALLLLLWHRQSGKSDDETQLPDAFELLGARLQGVDLAGADLVSIRLPGADLRRADLSSSDLSGAQLVSANLRGADFTEAMLPGADLTDADATGATFVEADLGGALLCGARFVASDLDAAVLTGVDLTGSDLSGSRLTRAILTNATTTRADLSGARMIGARLDRIDLRDAVLQDTDLRFASLREARMPEVVGTLFAARAAPDRDLIDGAPVRHLPLREPSVACRVAFEERWAIAIGCSDGTVQLWDPETGRLHAIRPGMGARIRALAAVSDDDERQLLAIGDESGRVVLWDVARDQPHGLLNHHADEVRAIHGVTLPGGARGVATADGSDVHLWRISDLALEARIDVAPEDVRGLEVVQGTDGRSGS